MPSVFRHNFRAWVPTPPNPICFKVGISMGAICERIFQRLNKFISWRCDGICLASFLFSAPEFLPFHYIVSRFLMFLNMVFFKDLPPSCLLWPPIRPEDLGAETPLFNAVFLKLGISWSSRGSCPFQHPHDVMSHTQTCTPTTELTPHNPRFLLLQILQLLRSWAEVRKEGPKPPWGVLGWSREGAHGVLLTGCPSPPLSCQSLSASRGEAGVVAIKETGWYQGT